MNALMNIQVRVISSAAQARIRMLEAEMAKLRGETAATGTAASRMSYGLPGLSKWGNQVQWAGRQLTYNFTLPILLATGAAVKFALDNEKAMVRVTKVYGDAQHQASDYQKEISSLGDAFAALSNKFGVAQSDVINLAGDWAAAGASGLALAKSVELTLQTMVLGEMDAKEATQALIAIQAQYGQNTAQLSKTIDVLNMVENQTGISMQGLIQGFARAAGVARSSGIDVEHLGAMLAALTPAAGSAAQAGNALKTMISRLLAPTKEATQVLDLMNIHTDELGWKSLNGAQRLEVMAKSFDKLDDAQKAVVSSVIASRYQINRFDVLMRDIINKNGYYQKSLNSTSDAQANFQQKTKELNAVLSSNPQRLKQIWVILQNAMADVVQPLIPYIVYLAGAIAKLFIAFQNLSPVIQKAALFGLIFLAAIGPIARYVGAVANLIGIMKGFFHFLGAQLLATGGLILKIVFGPFKLLFSVLTMLGSSALLMGRKVLQGFAMMTYGSGIVAKGWTAILTITTAFRAAFLSIWVGMLAVMNATWIVLMGRLKMIWASAWVFMRAALAPALLGLQSLWFAFMSAMSAAAATGMSVIRAVWALSFGAMAGSFAYFRASVLLAWGAFTAAMANIMMGARLALVSIWIGIQRAFVVAMAASATSITAIWGALVSAGRTFGLALAAIFAATGRSMLLIAALPGRALMAGFRAIPGLLARVWPAILAGVRTFGTLLFRALTSWVGLAVMAVLGIVYHFRDDIADAWDSIVAYFSNSTSDFANAMRGLAGIFSAGVKWISDMFWKLPESIRNALIAVVEIVKAAAMGVYHLLQYMNPFASHSPSLVDSVTNGVQEINKQYAKIGQGGILNQATKDLKDYGRVARQIGAAESREQRHDVAKGMKGALPVFNRLKGDLGSLNRLLGQQKNAVDAQQRTVDAWTKKLDQANNALDNQQDKLDKLQEKLSALNEEYQRHEDKLSGFADAPIKGMKRMDDAIFKNEMAQKRLRLEILKIQDDHSIDDSIDRMAKLAGDIEQLAGKRNELRAAGAGSDVLGPLNSQLKDMQATYDNMRLGHGKDDDDEHHLEHLRKKLAELERQSEKMDLRRSLKFDPLTRQIDQLANGMDELPFKKIIQGIKNQQKAMDGLQPKIDRMEKAVRRQENVVKRATVARDAISDRYDKESAKLDILNNKYQKTQDSIGDIESALQSMGSAASSNVAKLDAAAKKTEDLAKAAKDAKSATKTSPTAAELSPGAENFLAAKGGNFPEVGGAARIGREGGWGDQSKMIDQFTQGITKDVSGMFGSMDIFAPIKKYWNIAWGWVKDHVGPYVSIVGDAIKAAWNALPGLFESVKGSSFGKGFAEVWKTLVDIVKSAGKWIKDIIALFAPDIMRIFNSIVDGAKKIWKEIAPELEKFGGPLSDLGKAFSNLWKFIKPLTVVLGVTLLAVLKVAASIISHVFGPALELVINIVKRVIQIIRGIVEFVVGVFAGDWKMAWQGIVDIFAGLFGGIWDIIVGVVKIVWGAIKGFVVGIVEFFKWLADVLMGHSIIPDLIDGIIAYFKFLGKIPKWVWDHVLKPVWNFFKSLWNNYIKPFLKQWWKNVIAIWKALTKLGKWMWDHVLKPVWDWFKNLWNKYVKSFLKDWWRNILVVWTALKKLGRWVWDHVLKPVWDWFKDLWNKYVRPFLRDWWRNILVAWTALKMLGRWIWDHVLKPVFDKVRSLWQDHVGPALRGWWENLKNVWSNLKTAAKWVWDNVLKPVYTKFQDAWNAIKQWLSDNKDKIFGPIKDTINSVIGAINKMIGGLNKIADVLPGIDWKINLIPKLAQGGIPGMARRVGSGFKTNGARAIVGEGKANYPEYVIPTDPTHRQRAKSLWAAAGNRLGIPEHAGGGVLGIPAYDLGGIIGAAVGKVADWGKAGADWVGGKIGSIVSTIFKPFYNIADNLIDKVGWKYAHDPAQFALDSAWRWVKSADKVYEDRAKKMMPKGGNFQVNDPNNPNAHSIWKGGEFTNRFIAHLEAAQKLAHTGISVIQGGFSRSVSASGTSHYGDAIDTAVKNAVIVALRRVGIAAGDRTGLGSWDPHVHAIPGPSAGSAGGSAVWQWQDYMARGGMSQSLTSPWGLANGALIRRRQGGIMARLGEGSHDEMVAPLPKGWQHEFGNGSDGGDTTIIIEHLELPNIRSGDDAETFIKNLEILAKES